jgi:putative MATE family efflux protein
MSDGPGEPAEAARAVDDPVERSIEEQAEVEEELEEVGDAEGAPTLPSTTLAAAAAAGRNAEMAAAARRSGTGREIWRLAWPVMLSQVLVTIVGLVDIAMVGRIGPKAQAAVGYAGQFFALVQSALFAVGFACVAVMARAIGAKDLQRARSGLAGSLILAILVAIAFSIGILAAPRTVLGWLSAAPEVADLAIPYLQLVMLGSVLMAVALTLESALRANRDTKTPMRVAVAVTAVKLGLNALLIFGAFGFPRLELIGAGIATVASQVVAVAAFALVFLRQPKTSPLAIRCSDLAGVRALLPDLFRIALPGVAERLIMNLALLSYFGVLGQYGTVAVAAYTVGVRILAFSWIPGTAYAQAVATLIGQSLGAGDRAGATKAGWRAANLALATAVVLGLVCAFAREPLARLFTSDPETIAALGPFMLCLAIAQPFLQLHFTLGGAHRGAGDTWTPLVAAFVGNWVFRVPFSFLASEVTQLGLVAVWAVLILDHVSRAAWLLVSFRRGKWQDAGKRKR